MNLIGTLLLMFMMVAPQQTAGRGPLAAPRDPELEKQSAHSLEVARYYFYKRKPPKNDKAGNERLNKAVEDRLLEILDLNPTFGQADAVYFLLGEVYLRSDDPAKASEQFNRILKEFPDSQYLADTKKRIAELEGQPKGKKQN
jgi:hypothetical protein